MTLFMIAAGGITFVLLLYLIVALLKPEIFP